jgi:hypothetical protein
MRAFVYDDEIERVKKSLEAAPTISEALGKDWINNNLLNKEERLKKHAMFWMFLDESRCRKMEDWLLTLKTTLHDAKFTKIVNLMKEKKQEIEFYSFVAEIEVLSYYKKNEKNNYKVEFEPNIPGTTKVGDIKISYDSTEVFLEITRIFSSEEEQKFDKIKETIRESIDEIDGNPFVITFGITDRFSSADIKQFVQLVNQKITEQRDTFKESTGEPFTVDFDEKGWFKFHKKLEHKRGYVGGMLPPVLMIDSAARLKNKILDETEQLAEKQFNLIILDISYHFADFEDVEDAFAGQLGLRIDLKTMEGTPFRHANGIVQVDKGKKVGAIIAFKGFDYENRRKYVNLSAECLFTDDMLSQV